MSSEGVEEDSSSSMKLEDTQEAKSEAASDEDIFEKRGQSSERLRSPRLFPRLARAELSETPSPGLRNLGNRASKSSSHGADHGVNIMAEYFTKKLELQRPDQDSAVSEISFGSSLSRDSSLNMIELPTPSRSRKANSALTNLMYIRRLEGVEQRLKTTKEQVDRELEDFRDHCVEALRLLDDGEQRQLYSSLIGISESVKSLTFEELRLAGHGGLQENMDKLQLLRQNRQLAESGGQTSPVMRLVMIVSKLSRVADQFRPSKNSPVSSLILQSDAAESQLRYEPGQAVSRPPPRSISEEADMIVASFNIHSPSLDSGKADSTDADTDDQDSITGSADDTYPRDVGGRMDSSKLDGLHGGAWNLPSQLVFVLPKELQQQSGRDTYTDVDTEESVSPAIHVSATPSSAHQGGEPSPTLQSDDLLVCRICEEGQGKESFESHSSACSKIARSTQQVVKTNQSLVKFGKKIEDRAQNRRKTGEVRSEKQRQMLLRLAEICRLGDVNCLKSLGFGFRGPWNTSGERRKFSIPGGLLCEGGLDEIHSELNEIVATAEAASDSLLVQVSKKIRAEVLRLSAGLHDLCKECESFQEPGSTEKEERTIIPAASRLEKLFDSLNNDAMLTSMYAGCGSLIPCIDDFTILKPISRGAFGSVYLAKKNSTKDLFAIKALSKQDMLRKNLVTRVRTEKDILSGVANPFVVRSYWSFESATKLFIVMEYLPGGDMCSLLCNLGFLDLDVSRQYVAEIVLAIEYLHSMNVVHRDLKPDNVLIGKNGHVKLTDFGLSRLGLLESNLLNDNPWKQRTGEDTQPAARRFAENALRRVGSMKIAEILAEEEKVGTPDYLAPEILLGQGHSFTVDWWAVGVLLYEFLMGIPPFHASTAENIFENILDGKIDWPVVPDEVDEDGLDLIKGFLDPNPATRLGSKGAEEIRSHPFFAGVDWSKVLEQTPIFIPENSTFENTSYFDTGKRPSMFGKEEEDLQDLLQDAEELESSDEDRRVPRKSTKDKIFNDFSFQNIRNLEARNTEALNEALDEETGRSVGGERTPRQALQTELSPIASKVVGSQTLGSSGAGECLL
ncbi:hypothetical protein NDN08_006889 [Rhodosorus marinus]|uniref:non-specific serine/threonine protein kinase n=1 Tax=Rhodosorus marinus TaxID=101924 RepID=A0AAV8UIY5_9RHOD|nr:hypothetical protein NDN08_006889 [Rhodosorus marinus]